MTLINIEDKSKCCGCSACQTVCPKNCITMKEDGEGFLYPSIKSDLCVGCGLCEKVCPISHCEKDELKEQKAYLVRHTNNKICKESTSGGAFTAIANEIISRNGVVFGAAFDQDFNVHHIYVETTEELKKFRNSKYVQSNVDGSYKKVKEFLTADRWVLFSGTPCQVEGLYHYLGGTQEKLVLVDTVCRSVPSPLIWRKYKEYRNPKKDTYLKAASFRDKSKYGYQYSQMKLEYSDGRILYSGVESDPYLRAFFSNLIERPSCYSCVFKKRYRVSDLTIWDCFNVYKMDKSFDDNQGVTRILAHTKKGSSIVLSLLQCRIVEISPEVAIETSRELVYSVEENEKRKDFFEDALVLDACNLFNKWFPDSTRVKLERMARCSLEKLGLYRYAKRIARKVIGKD